MGFHKGAKWDVCVQPVIFIQKSSMCLALVLDFLFSSIVCVFHYSGTTKL
jgi:hypothetical protein